VINVDKPSNSIRLLTYNIRQGGGKRVDAIVARVLSYDPDIVVLTEYRTSTGSVLARKLADHGLVHQATSNPPPRLNGVFVASRLPFTPSPEREPPCPSPRFWLEVDFPQFRLGALYNGTIYNRLAKDLREAFYSWLAESLFTPTQQAFIVAGDFNWLAMEEGGLSQPGPVEDLCDAGYVDAWRQLNPNAWDYSWTNHNGTRTRVDFVFLTQPLAPMLANAFHAHDDSGTSVSDHDPLIVDLKEKGGISRVFDSLRRVGRGSTTSGGSHGNG
jgi:exonuclease III